MKKYEILGENLPVVVCELSPGESMITESGSMSWMSPNMKMETTTGGGMKKMLGRLVSGDSAFQNKFTAEGGDGIIAFASSFPGAIKALNISAGRSMIVQKSAFLASEEGVELSMHFQKKLGSGIFGGEGFIMQKLSGNGIAFIEIDGHAAEYDLGAGQELLVSTGYLAAMEESCTMDVVPVKGAKNMLLGGEGIFNTVVRGPGKVILQTMPISDAVFQQQKIRKDREENGHENQVQAVVPVPCGADAVQPHCLRQGQPGAQLDIGRNRADKASCGSGKRNNDPYKSVGSYLR